MQHCAGIQTVYMLLNAIIGQHSRQQWANGSTGWVSGTWHVCFAIKAALQKHCQDQAPTMVGAYSWQRDDRHAAWWDCGSPTCWSWTGWDSINSPARWIVAGVPHVPPLLIISKIATYLQQSNFVDSNRNWENQSRAKNNWSESRQSKLAQQGEHCLWPR